MLLNEQIEKLIQPTLSALGLNCVRVMVIDSSKSKTLQIMIERVDGQNVGTEDCQKASNDISVILDVEGIFSEKYFLEISSPGLSRPLTKISDWKKFKGFGVSIKTSVPIIGIAKSYKGKIISVEKNMITVYIESENKNVQIDFNLIEKANLVFTPNDFRNILKQRKKKKG